MIMSVIKKNYVAICVILNGYRGTAVRIYNKKVLQIVTQKENFLNVKLF